MPGFFIERAVQERLVGQVTEARLRAREIASSVTPAQMSRIQAGMQRNPTLPLSVQLALRNTDQDDLRDRIEAEYARRQSVDALYEDVQPQAPQQQNGNGFFGAVMDAAGGAKDAIGAAPGLLRQAGQAATAVPGVGSVFGAVGGQVGQVISDMPNSGFGNQVAKPIIRTGGAVLNVVPQAVQSIGRNVYAASNDQVMDRYMSAGGAMNFAQDVISQTDLGQMVAEGVRGDNPFDLGTSWYVDEQSDVYRNRLNAEINVGGVRDSGYLLYDDNGTTRRGEVFTGGRGLATILGYDPGSDGYQVISGLFDATVAVATPSIDRGFDDALRVTRGGATRLLGGTTEAQFTRAVGGYSGVVRQVDPLKVEQFLSSPSGTQVLERFAEETDFLSLWRMTGGKYEPQMVTRLADATNPAEVRSLLMENMYGLGQAPIIRSKPATWLSRTDRRPRWTADMPTTSIDLVDPRAAVEFMDDFATHVRIGSVDRTRRGAWMEAMARAENPIARRQVYHDALGDVASELILDDLGYGRHTIRRLVDDAAEAGGVDGGNLSQVRLAALERIAADGNSLDPADYANVAGAMRGTAAVVDQLTMYMNSIAETNRVMIDELVADGIWDWSAYQTQIGDLRLPSAFALSERASSLPAPNLRELRRATGGLRSLYFTLNDPGVMGKLSEITGLGPRQVTNSLITGTEGLQRFWKDMALLRPAYVLRVGGEEQLRMAVAGRNSMFNHPWRYISDMSGRSDFRNLGGTHLTNDEVFRTVSAGGSANGMRDTDAWSRGVMHQTRLQKGVDEPDEFLAAWLDELETIRVDEVFSRHLRSETVDETVDWLLGRKAEAPSSPASFPTPEPTYPGGMSRAEFEASGRRLYHGTTRDFDTFGAPSGRDTFYKGGVWRGDGFYFTEDPAFVDRFSMRDVTTGNVSDETFIEVLRGADTPAQREDVLRTTLRHNFEGEHAQGLWVSRFDDDWQEYYEYVSDLDRFPFEEFARGDVSIAGMASHRATTAIVHMPEVFGRSIDLRSTTAMPEDLFNAMQREGTIPDYMTYGRYVDDGRPLSWQQHERSAAMVAWLRENGYGSAQLRDDGADSFLVLPEFIKFGKNDPVENLGEMIRIDLNSPPSGLRVNLPREEGGGAALRAQLEEMHSRTFDEAFTRQYVESMTRRVRDATGGNDQILNYLRGEADAPDWASLVDEFAPPVTFGNSVSGVGPTRGAAARMGEKYDKKVERWFELLAGAPTDKLARHPTFVQFYRDTLIQLAPLAENPNVVRAMQQTGLFKGRWGRSMLADLEGVVGQGTLTIAQLDHLAKTKALAATRELLYDVSRRSQFFDTYRLLFPFGEAFKEQVTTWGRLFAETPGKVSRQAGGAVQAGRDAIVSDDLAHDPGMFYVNGNGEMVFTYPGTGTLTRALTGEAQEFTGFAGVAADAAGRLPGVGPLLQGAAEQLNAAPGTGIEMPMTGRVAGLNMMGETLPGVGPVVQYPAAYFLPPNPDNSWIRDVIMPFGDPGNPRDILANFAPAFARTFVMSGGGMTPDEQRRYGNSLYATLTYLESTGRYDTTNPAGIQQMKDDAQSGTTLLYWVRGTIQAFGPTSPRPEPGFVGENGEFVFLAVAKDRYQVLLEEDPENAVTRWMNEFGPGGFLAMQGNTVATVAGGVPLQGQSALDWVRDNPGVRDAHPDVYGFFAPRDGSTEFNYDAYLEAIENGELEVLTVDEKYDRGQHRVASSIYNQYRRAAVEAARAGGRMTPTREQSVMLQELRRNLGEDWDGYRPEGYGVSESVTSLIDKNVIEEALANPVLAETETGQALAEYWIAHNTAMAASQVQEINDDPYGYGWRDTNEGVAIRQYLRVTGEALATEYPEFRRMWEDFLIYEFRDIADEDPDYLELIGG